VQLTFTPTITSSGAIDLKVAPEVSALDYANAVTLQGFLIPAISQRRAETEVVLKDGESFAIAGLIDNRVMQAANRIPWLGQVPVLGNLFRSRSTKKSEDELLVVVTPHFVRPLPPGETAKLPDMQEAWLPTVADEKAKKDAKHKKGAEESEAKPEFVGPRGHQEPK
jgi:pilus assembly protein CpaC